MSCNISHQLAQTASSREVEPLRVHRVFDCLKRGDVRGVEAEAKRKAHVVRGQQARVNALNNMMRQALCWRDRLASWVVLKWERRTHRRKACLVRHANEVEVATVCKLIIAWRRRAQLHDLIDV